VRQVVVDASVAVAWGLRDDETGYAWAVLDELERGLGMAPSVLMLEIVAAILRAERNGRISPERADAYLERVGRVRLRLDGEAAGVATTRLLELGRRLGLSAHDAAYLELAERAGAELATLDKDLARAATACGVRVFGGRGVD
jgi:predicted nucleic acid-binding protein